MLIKVEGILLLYLNYTSIKLKKSGKGGRERKIKQRENMVYHYFAYIKLSIHSTNQSVIKTLKRYCARHVLRPKACIFFGWLFRSAIGSQNRKLYLELAEFTPTLGLIRLNAYWLNHFNFWVRWSSSHTFNCDKESPTWSRPTYSFKRPLLLHKIEVRKWNGLVWKAREIHRPLEYWNHAPDTTWSFWFRQNFRGNTHTQSLALNQDFLSTLNIMHDVQHAILTAIVRTPLLEKNNAVWQCAYHLTLLTVSFLYIKQG